MKISHNKRIKGTARTRRFFQSLSHILSSSVYQKFLQRSLAAPYACRSGVLRTPECGAELSLPTADLFGCALIRTPEQIRWSESLSGLQACGLSPPRLRSAPH